MKAKVFPLVRAAFMRSAIVSVTFLGIFLIAYHILEGRRPASETVSWVGVAVTMVLGLLAIHIAIVIFLEQMKISDRLERRIFGTLTNFEAVHDQAVNLLKDASQDRDSKVCVMMYWLWFGSDRVLASEEEIGSVTAQKAEIRRLLAHRRDDGLTTTVVVYDEKKATDELVDFLGNLVKWWRITKKKGKPEVEGDLIRDLVERYRADVAQFEMELGKAAPDEFKIVRRRQIPMLMFGATVPGKWAKALVCLAEKDILARGARLGGFQSERAEFVDVVMEQIKELARDEE